MPPPSGPSPPEELGLEPGLEPGLHPASSPPPSPMTRNARRRIATARRMPGIVTSTSEDRPTIRSEEHTSELQSLMRNSYAVFCLKKKNQKHKQSINKTNLS